MSIRKGLAEDRKKRLDDVMITQKEFIKRHRERLNKEFVEKYPDGQFVIQRRRGKVNLYVNFRRRTSGSHPIYPGAFGIEHANERHFYFIGGQNNSFGTVTVYKTLYKFLTACTKYFVNHEAVSEFLFFYNNNKDVPGFVEKVKENMHFCTKIHKTTVPGRKSSVWKK